MKIKTIALSLNVAPNALLANLKKRLHDRLNAALVSVVSWALANPQVEEMVIDAVLETRRFQRFVHGQVEEAVDERLGDGIEVDADNVSGLDRFVSESVENALEEFKDSGDFKDAISEVVDPEGLATDIANILAERMRRH